MVEWREWRVSARNLPEHAGNRIHTDEGARQAGFPSALVAGVTTYAYLCHPILEAWGVEWAERGGCELRLRAPVFRGDDVHCVPTVLGDDVVVVDALVGDSPSPRATVRAWRTGVASTVGRPGEQLPDYRTTLDARHGADYAVRAGDDLDLPIRAGFVHPGAWLSLANAVFAAELVRGPWIHTRSRVTHLALARPGADVTLSARVVERFVRSGERAVAEIEVRSDDRLVCTIEHEAIIDLSASR